MSEQSPGFDGPRSFLFVSARDPLGATRAVAEWAAGPPDLCVRSPSAAAHETAALACPSGAGEPIDEPLLVGRLPDETAADFAARTAEALRTLNAFETRAALVVWDDLLDGMPAVLDGDELLRRAESLERQIPAP
jgi:hypothetical protein